MNNKYIDLSWFQLALASTLIVITAALSVVLKLGLAGRLVVAAIRMVLQLVFIGLVLRWIFSLRQWYGVVFLIVRQVEPEELSQVALHHPRRIAYLVGQPQESRVEELRYRIHPPESIHPGQSQVFESVGTSWAGIVGQPVGKTHQFRQPLFQSLDHLPAFQQNLCSVADD